MDTNTGLVPVFKPDVLILSITTEPDIGVPSVAVGSAITGFCVQCIISGLVAIPHEQWAKSKTGLLGVV